MKKNTTTVSTLEEEKAGAKHLLGKDTLVVFGDSNVYGAELKDVPERHYDFKTEIHEPNNYENWPYHLKHSFPGIIANKYNLRLLNLSIPGGSNDTVFRRVNQFVQGWYPVNLNKCFVMVFWSGVTRREFFRSDGTTFVNYSPLWELKFQPHRKFHKVYSKELFNEGFDLRRTVNNIYSSTALLSHKNIKFVQGYALANRDLEQKVKALQIPKFMSYDSFDGITPLVVSKGTDYNTNPYICPNHHPSELGHIYVADTYLKLIDKMTDL